MKESQVIEQAAKEGGIAYAFKGVYSVYHPTELNGQAECTRDRYAPYYEGFIAGAKWASPSPPQKSKEEIIEQYTPNSEYPSYYHINQIEKMMQEYANQFTQPPSDKILIDALEKIKGWCPVGSAFEKTITKALNAYEKVNKDENSY